jgi:hypothetical protein
VELTKQLRAAMPAATLRRLEGQVALDAAAGQGGVADFRALQKELGLLRAALSAVGDAATYLSSSMCARAD